MKRAPRRGGLDGPQDGSPAVGDRDVNCNRKEDPLKISKMRGLAAGAVTALVVLGSGASAASAAPAKWNTPTNGQTTTTTGLVMKVKVSPTDTRTYTCAPGDFTSQNYTASNPYALGPGELSFNFEGFCSGPFGPNTVWVRYYGTGTRLQGEKVGSSYSLRGTDNSLLTINAGNAVWSGGAGTNTFYSLPWVNGTNPLAPVSTATYNNTQVAVTGTGAVITFTGTFRFKTPANGLLTLI
jgi:hypothetical protein